MVKRRPEQSKQKTKPSKQGKKETQDLDVYNSYADYVEEADEEEPQQEEIDSDEEQPVKKGEVSYAAIEELKEKLSTGKIAAYRKLVRVFRSATGTSEDNLKVSSTETYNEILALAMEKLPAYFKRKLNKKKDKAKIWPKLNPLVRSFLTNASVLLKQATEGPVIKSLLYNLSKMSKILHLFPEHFKLISKQVCKLWGDSERAIKLVCYNFIRSMYDSGTCDRLQVMKSLFLSYAKNSKFVSLENLPDLDLMRSCFVDLMAIDMSVGYQVVFIYLRQLSLHLSQVISHTSTDRVKAVYNWQYMNSLFLLGQAITHTPKELGQLVYPLVQISLGLLRLANSFKYYPLRLHIVKLLNTIEHNFKTYIPGIAPAVIEMLNSPEMNKRSRAERQKNIDLSIAIRASKEQIDSALYKEAIGRESCDVLIEHMKSIQNSIAYQDVVVPIKIACKKIAKNLKSGTLRGKLLQTIKVIEEMKPADNKK